jgi:uncharacterized protein YkwD
MLIRGLFLLFVLGGCFLPAIASSQAVAEEQTDAHQLSPTTPSPGGQTPDLAHVVARLIDLTNEFRQAEGHRTVTANPQLTATARDFVHFMAQTDKYGHTADGNTPAARAQQHGYEYCLIAENLAFQFSSAGFTTEELAQGFFQGWKDSPDHRTNMLDPRVTDTGVAAAQSEQTGNYYAVQMFGRPRSQMIEFQITNHANAVVQYEIGGQMLNLPPRLTRTHQQCLTDALIVHWPDGQAQTTVQPNNQDHYIIVQADTGQFRLRKE